jgi:hypothetical protein
VRRRAHNRLSFTPRAQPTDAFTRRVASRCSIPINHIIIGGV